MAAAEGNNYSSKDNRLWANTLRRAIVQSDGEKLRRIADKLIALAEDGESWAVKELGDRLDGKAAQAVALTGPDGEGLFDKIVREIVRPKNPDG